MNAWKDFISPMVFIAARHSSNLDKDLASYHIKQASEDSRNLVLGIVEGTQCSLTSVITFITKIIQESITSISGEREAPSFFQGCRDWRNMFRASEVVSSGSLIGSTKRISSSKTTQRRSELSAGYSYYQSSRPQPIIHGLRIKVCVLSLRRYARSL